MGMAVDFVHFETDVVPINGGGWRGSGCGMEAVGGHDGELIVGYEIFDCENWNRWSIRRLPPKPAAYGSHLDCREFNSTTIRKCRTSINLRSDCTAIPASPEPSKKIVFVA